MTTTQTQERNNGAEVRSSLRAESPNGLDRRHTIDNTEPTPDDREASTIDLRPEIDPMAGWSEEYDRQRHRIPQRQAVILQLWERLGTAEEQRRADVESNGGGKADLRTLSESGLIELQRTLIARLETPDDELPSIKRRGMLSGRIERLGEELSETEALILDVAHTISKGFRAGKAIPFQTLVRVTVAYHANVSRKDVQRAAARLVNRGICAKAMDEIRLVMHTEKPSEPSRFAKLTDDREQELLLIACSHCSGKPFVSQNIVSCDVLRRLMHARHGCSSRKINRLIRSLTTAGVLEEHAGDRFTGLRLTPAAVATLVSDQSRRTQRIEQRGRQQPDESGQTCNPDSSAEIADGVSTSRTEVRRVPADEYPRGFELSGMYPFLTQSEVRVLSVARMLQKGLSRGLSAECEQIRRICMKFYGMSRKRVAKTIRRLSKRGVAGRDQLRFWILPAAAEWTKSAGVPNEPIREDAADSSQQMQDTLPTLVIGASELTFSTTFSGAGNVLSYPGSADVRTLKEQQRARVFAKTSGRCAYCGRRAKTVDHVIPKSRGGQSTDANLLPCCTPCGEMKGDRTPGEWAADIAAVSAT